MKCDSQKEGGDRRKRLDRLEAKLAKGFGAARDGTWQLWCIPKQEYADALQYELGRELMRDGNDDLNRVPPLNLYAILADNRGRAWLELSSEERKPAAESLKSDAWGAMVFRSVTEGEPLKPPALLVPESTAGGDLSKLTSLSRPPLPSTLWARGNAKLLSDSARSFQLAIDFSKSFPSIMGAIEEALKAYAERVGIPLVTQSRGLKKREHFSGLRKLALARFRRLLRGKRLSEVATQWNSVAPEGWLLNVSTGNGYEELRNIGTDVRRLLKETFQSNRLPNEGVG